LHVQQAVFILKVPPRQSLGVEVQAILGDALPRYEKSISEHYFFRDESANWYLVGDATPAAETAYDLFSADGPRQMILMLESTGQARLNIGGQLEAVAPYSVATLAIFDKDDEPLLEERMSSMTVYDENTKEPSRPPGNAILAIARGVVAKVAPEDQQELEFVHRHRGLLKSEILAKRESLGFEGMAAMRAFRDALLYSHGIEGEFVEDQTWCFT
jgi:hypothetical protein